jgi:cell division protein FtsZ
MEGAKGVLFNITGSNLTLFEVSGAAEVIKQAIDPQANVIFGVVLDPSMGDDVRLTLIATGFANRETLAKADWEREISRLLKKAKSEEELDVPSFMRYPHALPGQKSQPVGQPRSSQDG